MEILVTALGPTLRLLLRLAPVMFLSLFGAEILLQLGFMRRLEPLGKPLVRLARLPPENTLTFLVGIGSLAAAHTTLARFHREGQVDDRELLLGAVLNTVPFNVKETFTYYLPVVVPILGWTAGLLYMAAFWVAAGAKLVFVIVYGRIRRRPSKPERDPFREFECRADDPHCVPRTFRQVAADAFRARKKQFLRMISLLGGVTLVVQILIASGLMEGLNRVVGPAAAAVGLPPAVVAPLGVYVLSPAAGIATMANLMAQGLVTDLQAAAALLAGGFVMIPLIRLRGTLPRYAAYFGFRLGAAVCGITAGFSLLGRAVVLVLMHLFAFVGRASG
jgi:hypothetical protein